jgi:Domain of unknown function (DUF1844)
LIRVSSQDKEIKVTDKRMFLPDGELREEYRFLDEKSTAPAEATVLEAAREAVAQEMPQQMPAASARPAPAYEAPSLEIPGGPPDLGPTFYDLVAILAEPIPIYLGDMELPDGQSAENLEMARLHIDLLDVLRQKTVGNLSAQENAFMEDLLYRMRVRYVQKTR